MSDHKPIQPPELLDPAAKAAPLKRPIKIYLCGVGAVQLQHFGVLTVSRESAVQAPIR